MSKLGNSGVKNGCWSSVMEADYLLDLVKDTPNHDRGIRVGTEDKIVCPDERLHQDPQCTPKCSLQLLEYDATCPGEKKVSLNAGHSLHTRKSTRCKKKRIVKKKWKLKSNLPLASYFQSPEDWNDLFLMSKMLGGNGEPSDDQRSVETSSAAESDDDDGDTEYTDKHFEYFDPVEGNRKSRPVEEMIKRKVIEARNKNEGATVSTEVNTTRPVNENLDNTDIIERPEYECADEIVDENGKKVTPRKIYNYAKRKFEVDKREARNARRRIKKRKERLYEKEPFDDPVMEARRLKAVKAKMIHDKFRFDLENLKLDAKELADENSRLKDELSAFMDREVRLLKMLEEKEATDTRNRELEEEINAMKKKEENFKATYNHIMEPQNVVVGVQVWWNLF